jgi:cytolysin-activating lysine-acyltransferase
MQSSRGRANAHHTNIYSELGAWALRAMHLGIEGMPCSATTASDRAFRLGMFIDLLARSQYHRAFPLAWYLKTEILPPLDRGQARLYCDPQGVAHGAVTWAWMSSACLAKVEQNGRSLRLAEWTNGTRLFFNDWLSFGSAFRPMMTDLTSRVFPDQVATSLRRNPDATVRRVNRWTGLTLRGRAVASQGADSAGASTAPWNVEGKTPEPALRIPIRLVSEGFFRSGPL